MEATGTETKEKNRKATHQQHHTNTADRRPKSKKIMHPVILQHIPLQAKGTHSARERGSEMRNTNDGKKKKIHVRREMVDRKEK